MANRSIPDRAERNLAQRPRSAEAAAAERGTRRPDGDARLFGRMKRAIRKAERRAGDGTEIGGTGATILKFLAAPLVRLVEKKRIGTEEVRAADDIAIAFHAQAGALIVAAWGASNLWTRVGELERQMQGAAPQFERIIRLETKVDGITGSLSEIKALINRRTDQKP